MADSSDFQNIRTLEELVNMVSILYFNLNKMDALYYDMFINPTPMTLELERYDETGKLTTVTLNNRAKDMATSYTGVGSPNGQQEARVGSLYVDTESYDVYYKSTGTDAYGWILFWTQDNFLQDVQYLSPTSEAPDLKKLNASNLGSGTVIVERGGTGVNTLTGLVKGNGTSPFTAAVDGVDYLGPNSMTGIVCYYPVNLKADGTTSAIPTGWLRCDGTAYSQVTYARLYNIIGTTYNTTETASDKFCVPNLYNHFIRCWDGTSTFNTVQQDNVGKHRHAISLNTQAESSHTHTRGTMDIYGEISADNTVVGNSHEGGSIDPNGAFFKVRDIAYDAHTTGSGGGGVLGFQASKNWDGHTSGGSAHVHAITGNTEYINSGSEDVTENRVLNKMMIPIIKY